MGFASWLPFGGIALIAGVVVLGLYAIKKTTPEKVPEVITALARLLPWYRRDVTRRAPVEEEVPAMPARAVED